MFVIGHRNRYTAKNIVVREKSKYKFAIKASFLVMNLSFAA